MNAPNAPERPSRGAPPNATPVEEVAPPPPARRRPALLRRLLPWLLVLLVLGGAGTWLWYRNAAAPQAAGPGRAAGRGGAGAPVPVAVAPARRQDVPIMLDALGTVQAYNTITVRAQVDGQLIEIAFQEGQEVKRGDVLARIDPRPYQAALDQAVAKKAQDEALLANARLDLERYAQLARTQGVSRQQQDTQRAQVAQYEAQVNADQAAIEAAQTQFSYTTIHSPIAGRVGLRLVDQGNLVRASDATGIVTVAQLRPIAVVFTLPQQALPQVRQAMQRGEVAVQATAPGAEGAVAGTLLTIDNQVDQATGTIRLKAAFANEDSRLWPGAFVNVRLQVDTVTGATTVPLVAVQRGPDGPYAFVLDQDGATVAQRGVELGPVTQTVAVVRGGLDPGDRVVTSGALRLSDGARVSVAEGNGPPGGGGGAAGAPAQQRQRRPRPAAEAEPAPAAPARTPR